MKLTSREKASDNFYEEFQQQKKAVKIRNRQQFLFVRHNIYGLLGDKSCGDGINCLMELILVIKTSQSFLFMWYFISIG